MADPIPAEKAAEWFLSQGFRAFPVWGVTDKGTCRCPKGATCESPGKHPATGDGGFHTATDDIEKVRVFLKNPGTPNYGLVCPLGVIAVDVDGEGKTKWDELQHQYGPLPATLTTVTADGWHFFYRVDPERIGKHLFKFVTRSRDKGYTVGPGSHHFTGVTYGLINGKSGIQTLPDKWVEAGLPKRTIRNIADATITVGGPADPATIEEGGRHDYLRDRARTLRGGGLEGQALFDAVWSINERLPSPKSREAVERAIGDVETKFSADPLRAENILSTPPTEEQVAEQRASIRTLLTLPYGTPPPPLVLDTFVAPEGWTVLYANGGTGKGLLALWMMRFVLLTEGVRIAVLDYEGHQWEWGNRARAIGWTDEELERVVYIDPYDPVWRKGHTLAGIAPELRPIGDDLNVALYVVDSYTTAAGSDTEMGGVKGAVDFFKAGAVLGKPGLTLAHTSAGEERFPAKPFGSSFVHNLSRETWAGAQVGSETGRLVKGQFGVTASSIQVELRNKKRSVGGRTTASQLFDIEFRSTGSIRIDYTQNYERPLRDLIADVLSSGAGAMTAKGIAAAIKEDYDRTVDETTITRTIARGIDGVDEVGFKRPKTYAAQVQDE